LENIEAEDKDWHPGSNKQVLNLIHPSLYCYVKGVSKIVDTNTAKKFSWKELMGCGSIEFNGDLNELDDEKEPKSKPKTEKNQTNQNFSKMRLRDLTHESDSENSKNEEEEEEEEDSENFYHNDGEGVADFEKEDILKKFTSKHFQWLPAEFHVDAKGKVQIKSYINNLHPVYHDKTYHAIAGIFEKFVPLFEHTLGFTPWKRNVKYNIKFYGEDDEDSEERKSDDDNYNNYLHGNWATYKVKSKVGKIKPYGIKDKKISLSNCNLQVIVKIGSTLLTPEDPNYQGGSWHVEGMINENIVATGIYYYDIDNITESRLNFRASLEGGQTMNQNLRGAAEQMLQYGMKKEQAMIKDLGFTTAEEGRCIVFPNIFQHQVQKFRLANSSKPGHRKILVFFLVDPTTHILSTERVPPQQPEWFEKEIFDRLLTNNKSKENKKTIKTQKTQKTQQTKPFFSKIPSFLIEHIKSYFGIPAMSREQAQKYRLKLMDERKYVTDKQNKHVMERIFSFCEH
jgi:hypothetical protein